MMVVAYVGLCLIWGTTWAAIQIGLRGIPPLSGVALRFAVAGVLLLLLAWIRRIRLGATTTERWLWVCNGLFAFCISYGVVYWAEQWVPSGLAAVLFATYPLFVAMLAHVMLPEELVSRKELIGIAIGFGGVAVIFSADFAALGGPQVAIAAAVMLLSPATAALASVAVKRWGAGVHPLSLTAVPMIFTGMVMGVLAARYESERTFVLDAVSVSALLYLAVMGSAVTFTLYYWLLSHLPAKRLALIAYIIPVIAMLIGAAKGEPVTLQTVGGSAMVLGGVALAIHRQTAKRYSR